MQHIRIDRQDGIAEVVMCRPKVNALNGPLLSELTQAMNQVAADETVKGAILRGEGSCYSAGLDLREVGSLEGAALGAFIDLLDDALIACFAFPKPLATPVAGHAIAGGLVLALTGDYFAIGKGDIKLGLTELAVGVPFPRSAFEIVRHGLPPRGLRRIVNEADTFSPAEAFELGCGDVLVDDPMAAARDWLDKVCSRSLETFAYVKRQQRKEFLDRIEARTQTERAALLETLQAARRKLA
jgi:enoyl-CoA hydratase/carnithine racemase